MTQAKPKPPSSHDGPALWQWLLDALLCLSTNCVVMPDTMPVFVNAWILTNNNDIDNSKNADNGYNNTYNYILKDGS